MGELGDEVQKFYDHGGSLLFEELIKLVNRQAIAPFFRPRLRRCGRILDAGSGPGYLANELGLRNAYFVDLVREQVKRCRQNMGPGFFIQADLERLPFKDCSFDGVICSNVLHYTGLEGFRELLRVTKKGGQMLLAFLEDSDFTRTAIRLGVSLGMFPSMMWNAQLIDLHEFMELDIKIKDRATIVFSPPLFHAYRESPQRGLVAFELEK